MDQTFEPASLPCLCTTVRKADRALNRHYDRYLRSTGLVTTQYSVLANIGRAPGPISITDLARKLLMDRTTLSRNLGPLEKAGLISFDAGPDRRTRLVSLSPLGQNRLAEARPLWAEAQRDAFSLLGAESSQALLKQLAVIPEWLHEE